MAEEKKNINKEKDRQGGTPKLPQFNVYWIYAIIFAVLIGITMLGGGQTPKTVPWSVFENKVLPGGDVSKIVVISNKGEAEVTLNEDALSKYSDILGDNKRFPRTGPHLLVKIPSIDIFYEARKTVEDTQGIVIPYEFEDRTNMFRDFFVMMLPFLLIIGIWVFFFRRMSSQGGSGGSGGIFSVGKSKARMFDKDSGISVTFKDVAGLAEAKIELEEIVEFLKKPEKFTELGGKIPKGALLVGPPGTGKTLLAKAVAGEANVPFFSMSGSDFVEMFVGVGASRVRDLFKKAKEKAPCIVFIDEIDAIGRARGKNVNFGGNDERENTLNQLLTEMDGFASNSGVIILAATNRADILDRALMRAGRFDRQIAVELPDLNERKEIFEVHLRPLRLAEDVQSEFMARQTPGFSGADIANVCNEAALIAARKSKKLVGKEDFLDAVDRIVGGLEKKNKIISKDEKRAVAYHESGHATISWLLEHAHPLVKVTIVPRGKALGAAWYLPEERSLNTYEQMLDEMCATLGGRAAEEVVFGRISTGALNDLEKVTRQATAMVSFFGMSPKIGNLSYYDSTGQSDYTFSKPYSEMTAQVIDEEIKRIVEEQYQRAKDILTANMEKLNQLAGLLLEKEVIFSEDLEHIFGKRQVTGHVIDEENHEAKEHSGGSEDNEDSVTQSADNV
ncbi:ATP-dependent zinc metalloprotease FtsH [Xiashengella succiniciproducens]|jgi:cell division protease FtsH|uniref:ATP-dependent zinc metalloprotease FtsH n=1 Tax=Xiashengella succiniciproducens TaxID=2949635 RepID=A0A9J6ZRB2_9BACT|nr:ATP-dependent zinc metalloprotease FtsH [Alkaliflexus sp. Ai-910]URW80094.1 ATP-dependent zinc metalloprotease FtsH [Alkaliflexus sp. Ai-910]